jgi:hypothetical protein
MGYSRHAGGGGPVRSWRDIGRTLSAMTMVSFGAYLVLCLFVLLYGINMVYPELETRAFRQYIMFTEVSHLMTISGGILQGWYLFLVGAIVVSAIWVGLTSRRKFLNELTMKGEARNHSPFFDLCGLMFMVLFINTVIAFALIGIGEAPISPIEEAETWELLFLLANASVWEELITRVLLIGLPLIAVDALLRRPRKLRRYLLGGEIAIGKAEVALILLSSTAFGFGHLESWGAWKVFPAGLAGVVFGYMFLRHGLAASILLHFSFDYMSAPLMVFEDSTALFVVLQICVILWLGVGLVFAAYYTTRAVEFILSRRFFDAPRPVQTTTAAPSQWQPPPQQVGTPSGWGQPQQDLQRRDAGQGAREYLPGFGSGFICPACGSTAARWMAGGLQCMRCGRIYE